MSRTRISRSLVTILLLTLIQTVAVPIFTNSALAFTQGTPTNGTSYGGTGGNANPANQNCSNGAIVAIGTSKSGQNLNTFMFVCKTINSDASLSSTEATTNVMGTPSQSDRCATGQIAFGIRVIASNGGTLVGGVGLICGNPMSRGSQDTRSIMPDALSAGTVSTFTCGAGQLLAGFALRTGSLVDQIIPKCSTFSGFSYAAVGAPTATVTGNAASVSFAPVTGSIADASLTYTVSAIPNSGSTITATGSGSPISVPGLVIRANYTVTVTASNAHGSSPSTSSALASMTLPGGDTDTALSLNGTNQFADVADTTGSAFDMTGTFTLQAWVKPANACPGSGAVISKNVSYMLYCQAGVWFIMALANGISGSGITTGVSVEPDEWHHLAISKISNSGNVLFYYDGVLVRTIATGVTAMAPNNNPFQIGQYTGSYFFNGQIDQVHVYNTQRTQTQIAADMNAYGLITDSALMAYYDFNEGSGVSTLYNRKSGATSATDLTIRNSPTFTDVKIDSTFGAYSVVSFPRTYITSTGGWRVPSAVTRVQYLVVAGGGAGGGNIGTPGNFAGGGGGGGGVRTGILSPTSYSAIAVVVGSGQLAPGTTTAGCEQGRGGNSSISGSGVATISSTGGGSGACAKASQSEIIHANSGGSGGGGGAWVTNLGTAGSGNFGSYSPVEGFAGGSGRGDSNSGLRQSGGGGGGASAAGTSGSLHDATYAKGGVGGDGLASNITGSSVAYGGGGGGGTRGTIYGGAGGAGGGGAGGGYASTDGVPRGSAGTPGLGGGGGGNSGPGNNGGSGVIIIRWITAPRPIFTQPLIDTTTAGLTETITVSADPIAPLIRNYQWQSSSDTGTTWSNIASGSGALTNTYTTPILETTTSGPRFQYRVIVTDSDTAGLSIVDTSVAVFIVVNPRITFSGTFTPQKYGEGDSDTFTVLNGSGNKTVVRTSSNRAGITWNFNTLNTAVVNVAPTLSVGTYLETITATDTRGAQTQLVISVVVTKADTITVTALARGDTFTGSALTFTPSFTVTGLKNSDTVTPVIYNFSGADNAGANFASSTTRPINAGSYIITPSVPASLTDSYTAVTIVTGALTINRATRTLSVIAPASPLKYGETRTITSTLSAGAGDGALTYLTSTPDSCTVSSTTVQAVRASGSCSFTAQITRGNNFETATASAATTTLARADTITVQLRNPVTLTFTGNPAASVPTQTIIGLVHTDAATTTRLYSHPASAVGAPESYAALVNSATAPTDVESYTVSSSTLNFSSGLASNYQNIVYETSTLIINQANQQPLRIAMYGAYIGSSYSIITDGGSGGGVVVESTTAGSTAANCVINSRILTTTSTVQSVCNILVTKGASRNFKVETTTAQITFYLFIPVVSVPVASGGPTIGITGENTVTIDAVGAPTITSLSSTTISLGAGGSITITGTGFGSSALTVKFWRDKAVTVTPTNSTTITVSVADIAAAEGTSGRISVITVGGLGVSVDRLTINP